MKNTTMGYRVGYRIGTCLMILLILAIAFGSWYGFVSLLMHLF